MYYKINIWYLSSLIISTIVAIPILTVFGSFFETRYADPTPIISVINKTPINKNIELRM